MNIYIAVEYEIEDMTIHGVFLDKSKAEKYVNLLKQIDISGSFDIIEEKTKDEEINENTKVVDYFQVHAVLCENKKIIDFYYKKEKNFYSKDVYTEIFSKYSIACYSINSFEEAKNELLKHLRYID